MKRDLSKTKDLLADFSKSKSKVERVTHNPKPPTDKRGYAETRKRNRPYDKFLAKLENQDLSNFNSQDIMYFFRDAAHKAGIKYVISKPQIVMRNFNLAKERGYTNEEILLMIEFLFMSDQTYLDKRNLHPGILLTGWCNKIYQDSQLWLKDAYVDKKVSHRRAREWEKVETKDDAKIGEWDI